MSATRDNVAAVAQHPRLKGLEGGPQDRKRLERFAVDLAYWLAGGNRDDVGALVRVVSVVAARELRDPRQICKDRPLLAVEASARTVERLWPLLRVDEDEEPPAEQEPEPPKGQGGQGGAGEGGDGEANPQKGSGPGSGQSAMDALERLAEMNDSSDLDSLEKLAQRLEEQFGEKQNSDWETAAGEAMSEATGVAIEGALAADRGARLLEHFLPGVGWSSAPGVLHQRMVAHIGRLAQLLSQLSGLKQIADMLGRMETPESEKWWDQGGGEEVVGVTMSGQVTLALPSEMGLLGDAATEDLFYQRWQERRLVSLELVGGGMDGSGKAEGRGPVIACVDTSGSMSGPAEAGAKALILALCRRVLPQGRAIHLMAFGGPGELENLVLKKGRGGLEDVISFLALRFDGGTDFDTPLVEAMKCLEERSWEKADVLIVTDGRCIPSSHVVEQVKRAKATTGVRVWSVVFGRKWEQGVGPFSDKVWLVDADNAATGLGFLRRI